MIMLASMLIRHGQRESLEEIQVSKSFIFETSYQKVFILALVSSVMDAVVIESRLAIEDHS